LFDLRYFPLIADFFLFIEQQARNQVHPYSAGSAAAEEASHGEVPQEGRL